MASLLPPLFLLLLTLSCSLAAPVESPATENPFLEGLDDFLAAFDGLALGGDPMATPEPAATETTETTEPHEPEVVTEVAPCLGCVHELESDSVKLRELAQLAAQLLEEELNMTQVTEVTQVYRAAYQVVNGIKYYLTLELTPTNCSRPLETEGAACLADPEAQPLLFSVEILEPPQQELDTQLLELSEVTPEEVLHLPGLLADSEPAQPPTPALAATEGPSDIADLEGDLLVMVNEMQRFKEAEPYAFQDDPATIMRHMKRYGITW